MKPAELSHDTAVYRAALGERARIEADGGRVVRVRIDAELKAIVATATEKARAEGGDRAAEDAKRAAAHELGLPLQDNRVMYPDAQLDIEDSRRRERPGERGGRVRPLPRGGDRGEGRGRVCDARQQPQRHQEDRPRAGARNRRRTRRRSRIPRPGWFGGAVTMQPITVAVGLTVTLLALTVLLCLPEFVYLAPHTRVLTALYWPPLTAYGALAILTFLVALYTGARAAGLADLGRKVDLVERSIRRGAGGDPELAEQMQQQDRGDYQD